MGIVKSNCLGNGNYNLKLNILSDDVTPVLHENKNFFVWLISKISALFLSIFSKSNQYIRFSIDVDGKSPEIIRVKKTDLINALEYFEKNQQLNPEQLTGDDFKNAMSLFVENTLQSGLFKVNSLKDFKLKLPNKELPQTMKAKVNDAAGSLANLLVGMIPAKRLPTPTPPTSQGLQTMTSSTTTTVTSSANPQTATVTHRNTPSSANAEQDMPEKDQTKLNNKVPKNRAASTSTPSTVASNSTPIESNKVDHSASSPSSGGWSLLSSMMPNNSTPTASIPVETVATSTAAPASASVSPPAILSGSVPPVKAELSFTVGTKWNFDRLFANDSKPVVAIQAPASTVVKEEETLSAPKPTVVGKPVSFMDALKASVRTNAPNSLAETMNQKTSQATVVAEEEETLSAPKPTVVGKPVSFMDALKESVRKNAAKSLAETVNQKAS